MAQSRPKNHPANTLTHEINRYWMFLVAGLGSGLLYALFVGNREPFTDENTKAQPGEELA